MLDEVGVTLADAGLCEHVAAQNGQIHPNDADHEEVKHCAIATCFVCGTNERYQPYIKHLQNSFLDGYNNYPTTLHEAYNILQ